jgi:hypothetical protein
VAAAADHAHDVTEADHDTRQTSDLDDALDSENPSYILTIIMPMREWGKHSKDDHRDRFYLERKGTKPAERGAPQSYRFSESPVT